MLKSLAVCITLVTLAGCLPHSPAEVALPVELPPQYHGLQAAAEPDLPVEPWWWSFGDEQLNLLMDELFAGNLELSQALARLEQVEAAWRITRSAQAPTLAGAGSLSRSRQPGLSDDFTGDSRQLSLAAGFELDLWGKLAARSRGASLELAASRQDVQTLYLGLSARLADLYFLAVEQRAQLALTGQIIASYTETAERVASRYDKGLVPAVDMYQARQSLSGAQAAEQLFAARLATAEHALAVLLGHYPQPAAAAGLTQLPAAPALFATGIPAELISRRPDLRAALQRVAVADARVAAAIAERFPSIGLSGNYGTLHQEIAAGLLEGDFWSLLGNLALPLVDGGRRRAEVDRQAAALREAVAAYQQQVLHAFQEVEDALANNYATGQRVDRLAETAEATGATLRLSTERYLAGLVDYLPVLTAQRADAETRSRLLDARRQLLADRISLARALGGVWMQEPLNARLQGAKD